MSEIRNENINNENEVKEVKEKVTKPKKNDEQAVHQSDVQQTVFKKVTELTLLDIKNLQRASVILKKAENKKYKNVSYSLEIRLNDLLKVRKNLSETRFNLLKIKLGLDFKKAEETLRVPVRFCSGLTKKGFIYHQLEVVLKVEPIIFESYFFDFDEYELLEATLFEQVNFAERPEPIEDKDLSNGNE